MKKALRILIALTVMATLIGGAFAGSAAGQNIAISDSDAGAQAVGSDTLSFTDSDTNAGVVEDAGSTSSSSSLSIAAAV